jgi:hypothetical protein
MLTALEHRAVINALEWLRGEYDCAYAIERGIKGAEIGALTRAIRKLGGDPYPKRKLTPAMIDIVKILEIERNSHQRMQKALEAAGDEILPVGIVRKGEISFDVDFNYADDAEEQLRARVPARRRIGFMRGEDQ